MFDEYLNPSLCVDPQVLTVIAPELADSTGTPSSNTIDQDAPSTSTSRTTLETQSPIIPLSVEEADHDNEVAHMDNNPFVEFLIPEPSFEESSTQVVIPNHVHSIKQPPEHINKWTKDHPIDNVIGDPSRLSYKDALTESCWIKAVQEELNEFEHLEDPENPNHVYKLQKALYGLKQAPLACMETFEPANTPMVKKSKLDEDPQGKSVNPTRYRGMIGTLMYLTASRPDLVFVVCMCTRIMNPQETQQVAARDEKWVPFNERVNISSTNVKMETTVPQKEDTFQVVIDLIKNSKCFKAFTISADVSEIFMQQFWYSIKKVQGTDSYEFLLANKKCMVNANVFRTILDICLRVEGIKFTDTASNDKLRNSRIDILWGMFYRENVDYPELIWEDLDFHIDNRKEKRSRQSEPELKPVKRKTASKKRVVKKKVTISADDNIISNDLNVALELGTSINKTEAEEVEATRQVHVTHARIVTKSVLETTRRRKSSKVTFDPFKKLKGVPSPTLEEQKAADTMQALKESRKISKRQPGIGGSSEETDTIPGVPDDSTVISITSSEGTDQLDDEEKDDKEGDVDDECNDHISDPKDTNDEDGETEFDEDEIYKYKIRVRKDEDEEMLNVEAKDFGKGDAEVFDTAKADAEKTKKAKDDSKKAELPPTSSSLSISSGFGDQFLKLSSDTSLVAPAITPPLPSVSTTSPTPQQTTTPLPPPPITTDTPIITCVVSESDALSVV
nr:hypothetical protein [Tanacetum cinerariifolium]